MIPRYRKVAIGEPYYGIHEFFIVLDSFYGVGVFFLCEEDAVVFGFSPAGEIRIGTVQDRIAFALTAAALGAASITLDTYARPYNASL